jgi:predicted PurR-regulated permease PerM
MRNERAPLGGPGFARRIVTSIAVASLAAAALFLLWQVREIVLLAFAGVLVAVLLTAPVTWVHEHTPLPRAWSLVLVLLALVLVGVLTAAGLWLLDVPLVFTLGLLAALLDFIPNFGPVLAATPALLLAMLQGPRQALYVEDILGDSTDSEPSGSNAPAQAT